LCGRVGFVVGIMYPESRFLGPELMPPRVDVANNVMKKLGISDRVEMIAIDLAEPNLDLPVADVYLSFSSFSPEAGAEVSKYLVGLAKAGHRYRFVGFYHGDHIAKGPIRFSRVKRNGIVFYKPRWWCRF